MAEPERGSSVFLDAVVMYHHFVTTGEGDELNRGCTALLGRCETGDVVGHTCTVALAEAVHKVMITEACARFGWARAGAVARLRRAPERLAALTAHSQVLPTMAGLGVHCHDTVMADIELAAELSRQFGLLTNDAIIAATMQRLGIRRLATLDDDFARVPWVSAWMPAVR